MERASGSKKISVRILSFLLAAIMVVGIFPISVFADEELETALKDTELLVEEEPEVIAEPEEELAEEDEPENPEEAGETEETEEVPEEALEDPEVTEEVEQEPTEETEPEVPEETEETEEVEIPEIPEEVEETEEVFEETAEEPEISEEVIEESIEVGTFKAEPEGDPLVVDLSIVSPKETYKTGDEIKFQLNITKNPGVASLFFTVKYDKTVFEVVNTTKISPKISSTFSKNANQFAVNAENAGEIIFNWIYSGVKDGKDFITTGTFAELTLKVKSEVVNKCPAYSISVEPDSENVFNAAENEVTVAEIEDEEVAIVKTITFNANGGPYTPVSVIKTYGEPVPLPDLSADIKQLKKGCNLIGWDENKNAEKPTYDPGEEFTVEEDKTLYAIWKMAEYTITYNYIDGIAGDISEYPPSYNIETETIKFGTTVPNPTRKGYSFVGWYSDPTLSKKVTQIAKGSVGDMTLYASWKLLSFTIKYNLNGGKELTEETTPDGAVEHYTKNPTKYSAADPDIELNTHITKVGYDFDGWFKDKACSDSEFVEIIESDSAINYTLYAGWEENEYTIKFDANGGEGSIASGRVKYSEKYVLPDNLKEPQITREGCKFAGWTAEIDGKTKTYSNKASVSKLTAENGAEITLYAKWTPNKTYTIKYNLDGGKEVTKDPVTGASIPKNPTKYSVVDGGVEGKVFLRDPVKEGFDFVGWYNSADNSKLHCDTVDGINVYYIESNIAANITVYAKWDEHTYTIHFVDSTGKNAPVDISGIGYDDKVTINGLFQENDKTMFSREDCKALTSWVAVVDGKEKTYSNTTSISKIAAKEETDDKITFTAKWTPNTTYTIKYTLNGGKEAPRKDPITNKDIKNPTKFSILDVENGKTIVLNQCQKAGYKFTGWYDNKVIAEENKIEAIDQVKEDGTGYTLYAGFEPNTYKIIFDGNGANDPAAMTYIENVDDTVATQLKANEFKKTGYKFAGWTATVAGKEKSFSDKAKVSKLTTMGEGELTFTAKWTLLSYTIKYNLNGGKEVVDPETKIKNPTKFSVEDLKSGAIILNPCEKAGYKFTGWYDNKVIDEGNKIEAINQVKEDGTGYTLYAGFESNTYKIIFDGNGANDPAAMTYIENVDDTVATQLTPNAFVKDGCKFAGWTATVAGKEKSFSDKAKVSKLTTMGEGELTFTAKWTSLKTYTIKYNLTGGKEAPRKDPITNKDIKNPTKIGMADGDLILNEAVKEGFDFAGWYYNSPNNTELNNKELPYDTVDGKKVYYVECDITENITVYAKWVFKSRD